jgi:hypothetical protein
MVWRVAQRGYPILSQGSEKGQGVDAGTTTSAGDEEMIARQQAAAKREGVIVSIG